MIQFRKYLEDRIRTMCQTELTTSVKTYSDHLYDVEMEQMPFLVVNVRTAEKASDGEIGNDYDLYMWTVHIYYLDIADDYTVGDDRRDDILSRIHKLFEENRRLQNLEVTANGKREYVYDSSVSAVLFDMSGQEEYYSFVSELYLNVYTARNKSS